MRTTPNIFRILIFLLTAAVLIESSPAAAAIAGTTWFPIGPAPINAPSFFLGGVVGRATAVAVNPANGNEIWVGTATGGVWHSTNGGVKWLPISDDAVSLAIGALAVQGCTAAGCARVYAGTGENSIRRDTYHGEGLLIGEETGGEFSTFAWTLRNGSPYNFSRGSINDVVLDPTTSGNSTRIFVTLSSGVTASATESTVTAPEPAPGGYGIYRSDNNGVSWTKLTIQGSAGSKPTDLKIDPAHNNILYAGFLGKGVFKSTDSGTSWCPLTPGISGATGCPAAHDLPSPLSNTFDHVELAIAPSNSSTLYAFLGQCPSPLLSSCIPSIFKSTDSGTHWSQTLVGNPMISLNAGCPYVYSRYTHTLVVHPAIPETLFLGGVSLCKSTNSGQTFANSDGNTFGGGLHLDHHDIVFDPSNAMRMFDVNDGGFASSTNGGLSWTPLNSDLQITGFQSVASSPLTGRIIAAAQDNGTELWSGSRTWDFKSSGDGGFTIMDRGDLMKMFTTATFGTPYRSTNGGAFFSSLSSPGSSDPRSFYPPFVQDPSTPFPLYYATHTLYKSTNSGDLWTAVSPALSLSAQPEIWGGMNVITAIAIAPNDPSRIFIGYYGGEIFTTNSACASAACWTSVGGSAKGLPQAPVTRIAVHPTSATTAYITFSGFGGGAHVFKTTNSGSTWAAAATGLPVIPANTVSIEPSTPNSLWLGTDQGVYKSTDAGASWSHFSSGLPNVPVYEISIDETHGRVYAATHGRGAYVLSRPFLANFEGWVHGGIWDIPVYGHAFLPNQTCTMTIYLRDGTVCATGSVDAMGGTIMTDGDGTLVTSKGGFYSGQPVVWGCYNGTCLGGANIADCNHATNPISSVSATCGGLVGFETVLGCPALANPPSTLMGLSGLPGGPVAGIAAASLAAGGGGSFNITASVQAGDGTTRSLCTAAVPIHSSDSAETLLERTEEALNDSESCAQAGVTADLVGELFEPGEDLLEAPRLAIKANGVIGGQLYTSLHVPPGVAVGRCFEVTGLGVPVLDQIQIPRVAFETVQNGTGGGELTLEEYSPLGTCRITVPTTFGESATQIAQALEAAFQAPGIPGPHPLCPSSQNPRDVLASGPSVISVLASGWRVCIDDPRLGFSIRPEEMPGSHPTANAGTSRAEECTGPGGASVRLDGSASSDPDSTPGTHDDIVSFEWFENFAQPGQNLLGTGAVLMVQLPLGAHSITLRVTDHTGLTATHQTQIDVADTTAPQLSVRVTPARLWPPNHKMVDIGATVSSSDTCGTPRVVLTSVKSNEPDDARGNGDGHTVGDILGVMTGAPDFMFQLRAERQGRGTGRIYQVTYTAIDPAGNRASATTEVRVAHH